MGPKISKQGNQPGSKEPDGGGSPHKGDKNSQMIFLDSSGFIPNSQEASMAHSFIKGFMHDAEQN